LSDNAPEKNSGSFRDPSGYVFEKDGRILRVVTAAGAPDYERARDAGIFERLVEDGRLVPLTEVDEPISGPVAARYVLEHERIRYVTYPYEWSFELLKCAALFHLDLQIDLLERGFTLSDATAYNIQFRGIRPVFIDHLSIRAYREGEYWLGHSQFCQQFLNPLLLRVFRDINPNSWYRGNLEGISVSDFARLVPFRKKFSWNVFTNVVLQERFQRGTSSGPDKAAGVTRRPLPKEGYLGLLKQLRNWINRLEPRNAVRTVWADYSDKNTYADEEHRLKREFVAAFVQDLKPDTYIDLGCNTGEYSELALENGAGYALGFDFDQQALDSAYGRAQAKKLNFLPVYLDARNPSPNQGWRQTERKGFAERFRADAVVALAFEHHLAIAHNVPLAEVIGWITAIAPQGVIEFVPKSDPTIRRMLALREDIFPGYTEEAFVAELSAVGEIVAKQQVSQSGRTLFRFRRNG
jgi:ribosomal protein L11 methylase PrmA